MQFRSFKLKPMSESPDEKCSASYHRSLIKKFYIAKMSSVNQTGLLTPNLGAFLLYQGGGFHVNWNYDQFNFLVHLHTDKKPLRKHSGTGILIFHIPSRWRSLPWIVRILGGKLSCLSRAIAQAGPYYQTSSLYASKSRRKTQET